MIVVVGALLGLSALAAKVDARANSDARNVNQCNGPLYPLRTFSDPKRRTVRVTPRTTTIEAIGERGRPQPTPTIRKTPFQKQAWEVVASVDSYRLDHGELRLVLFDHGAYVNAAVPSPACIPANARQRKEMMAVWTLFTTKCGHPTGDWQPLGAVAYVGGVGFWSGARSGRGIAPNGAELHPVTDFRPVAGC
ncbi:MAG: hypothetical protein E6G50_10700 [Actinobacteria bacterium]|nr:MAG: hypothetical protein E6G50_10700 [Actinomycetota bacterium]